MALFSRRLLPLLALASLLLSSAAPVMAQAPAQTGWVNRLSDRWVSQLQMNPYNNDEIYAAGNDPNGNVFAFRSADGGFSWSDVGRGLPPFSVFALAIAPGRPQTLMIGGFNIPNRTAGLYRSDDSGQTWAQMPGAVRDIGNRSIQALMFDIATEKITYVGTDDGLFQTRDNGATWQMLGGGGISHQNIHVIKPESQWNPKRQTCCEPGSSNKPTVWGPLDTWVGADATTGGGAWRSPDLGVEWQFVNAGLPNANTVYQFATDPTRYGYLWAAVDTGGSTSLWHAIVGAGDVQIVPVSPWRFMAKMDRIVGLQVEIITNNNEGAHNVYYTSPSGLYLGREQGDQIVFQKVSEVGANAPIQLGTTVPQRLYVGGKGVSMWVTGTVPIPMKLGS